MYIEQFYYLAALSKYASLSQAAEALFISQPALSKSIINMEKELDLKLLIRNHEGVSLTEDGKKIAQYADNIIANLENIRAFAAKRDHQQELKFAAVSGICNTLLTGTMTAYYLRHPAIRVVIIEKPTEEIVERIVLEGVEFGIISIPSAEKRRKENILTNKKLDFTLLLRDQVALWMNSQHPLASKQEITNQDLEQGQYPFLTASTGYEAFELDGLLNYNQVFENTDSNLIKRLLLSNNMLTVLPKILAVDDPLVRSGQLVTRSFIGGSDMEYYLVKLRDTKLSAQSNEFLSIFLEQVANYQNI